MRHFHLHRQPHEQQHQRVRATAHVCAGAPANAAAPATGAAPVDAALDQAAALWTTRRIRSFLVLQPSCAPRR